MEEGTPAILNYQNGEVGLQMPGFLLGLPIHTMLSRLRILKASTGNVNITGIQRILSYEVTNACHAYIGRNILEFRAFEPQPDYSADPFHWISNLVIVSCD